MKNTKKQEIQPVEKKSRQGNGRNTKYAATARNGARKKSRGQGKG
jgi:hypothetical protein